MKATIIKLLKPTLYFVERDKFLGDFTRRLVAYRIYGNSIVYTDTNSGLEVILKFNDVFLLERNAKKEASKSIIPVNRKNESLVKEIESKGVKLTNYQRQQILEDGDASEVYQEYK